MAQGHELGKRSEESRNVLWNLPVGLVEYVTRDRAEPVQGNREFSPEFQVALPSRGLLVWHVGGKDVVGDANQVLFVTGGEEFEISSPTGAYAELIITPPLRILSQLAEASASSLRGHPLFKSRSSRASRHLQILRAQFLYCSTRSSNVDDLHAQELVLALLRTALHVERAPEAPRAPSTARLIRRAQEFLEAEHSRPIRLVDVADAVGTSPAYLTDTFRRVEGMSLHRYRTRLRLARARDEVPHASDLTQLALEIGFSSHSHFTATFRRAFGCTPSEFRATTRGHG